MHATISNPAAQQEQYSLASCLSGKSASGTWYKPGTTENVKGIIEKYMANNRRLRLFFGDPETGRDYQHDKNVIGWVRQSEGIVRTPRLICRNGTNCRHDLNTCHIVRIMDVQTGSELFRHRHFHTPKLEIRTCLDAPLTVWSGDTLKGEFGSMREACSYVEFLYGWSMLH